MAPIPGASYSRHCVGVERGRSILRPCGTYLNRRIQLLECLPDLFRDSCWFLDWRDTILQPCGLFCYTTAD